jgi:hypothetical protein
MPTTNKAPEAPSIPDPDALAAVADWIDSQQGDDPDAAERNRTIAANRLDRFGGAVELAALADAATEATGSHCTVSLHLERGAERTSMPAVVHVPMRINKQGVWTTGTVNVHTSDRLALAVVNVDGALAVVTDPPVVEAWSKSASDRIPLRDSLGRSTGKDALVRVQKPAPGDTRTPWNISAVVATSGGRGAPKKACV